MNYTIGDVLELKNSPFFSQDYAPRRLFCLDNIEQKIGCDYITFRMIEDNAGGIFRTYQTALYNPFAQFTDIIKSKMSKEQFNSIWLVIGQKHV
jgi:hypothetical protein